MTDLEICAKVYELAKKRAEEWVRSFPYGSYTNVGNIHLDFHNKKIHFRAYPSSSGIGWEQSIDMKYIEDDSTLKEDAEKWYKEEQRKSELKTLEIRRLEESPDVKLYKKLSAGNVYLQTYNG